MANTSKRQWLPYNKVKRAAFEIGGRRRTEVAVPVHTGIDARRSPTEGGRLLKEADPGEVRSATSEFFAVSRPNRDGVVYGGTTMTDHRAASGRQHH